MNEFRKLWDLGYRRLLPIAPPDAAISQNPKHTGLTAEKAGKIPGKLMTEGPYAGQWHAFADWQNYVAIEADLERWRGWDGVGAGVLLGIQHDGSFLVALDADTSDPEFADDIEQGIITEVGPVPTRVGRPPRALYLVRVDEPIPYTRIIFKDRDGEPAMLEILTQGKQFVAFGLHRGTGRPYTWTRELVPLADLPVMRARNLTG